MPWQTVLFGEQDSFQKRVDLVVLADDQDIIALRTALHRAFGKQRRLGRTRDEAGVGEAARTQSVAVGNSNAPCPAACRD